MCSATGNVRYGHVVVNSADIAAYLDYRYP